MRFAQIQQMPQQSPAVASNPVNGINNIPLTNNTGTPVSTDAVGEEDTSLSKDELLDVLDSIINNGAQQAENYRFDVESLIEKSQNPHIQEQLRRLLNTLSMTKDPNKQTIDPATGEEDPGAADIATQISEEVKQMTNNDQQQKQASRNPQISYRISLREVQAAKKTKKTRGNPFRVLMGKVGKLLDHGLEKSTIVREIKKRINFDEDTISRCVDIVRDYNKKKRRNDRATGNTDTKGKKSEKKSDDDKDTEKSAAIMPFNAKRYAQALYTREIGDTSIYDVKPEYAKRSTAELMARASWLQDLHDIGKKAASQDGVVAELKAIRTALKERGFEEKELVG